MDETCHCGLPVIKGTSAQSFHAGCGKCPHLCKCRFSGIEPLTGQYLHRPGYETKICCAVCEEPAWCRLGAYRMYHTKAERKRAVDESMEQPAPGWVRCGSTWIYPQPQGPNIQIIRWALLTDRKQFENRKSNQLYKQYLRHSDLLDYWHRSLNLNRSTVEQLTRVFLCKEACRGPVQNKFDQEDNIKLFDQRLTITTFRNEDELVPCYDPDCIDCYDHFDLTETYGLYSEATIKALRLLKH